MRSAPIVFFILFLFQSCQQKQQDKGSYDAPPKDCDSVVMIYYNHNDTLRYVTADSLEIAALVEPIAWNLSKIADSCKPSGELLYKRNGKIIFVAQFSTSDSNDSLDCDYVAYSIKGHNFKHKLPDRTGMFIDDVMSGKLKWSSLSSHGPIRLHGDTGTVEDKEFTRALKNLISDSTRR